MRLKTSVRVIVAAGLAFWAGSCVAATLSVPQAFGSIQEAVDAAQSGDEIVIGPGTYSAPITIAGKSITLRSTTGNPEDVILRAGDGGRIVRIENATAVRLAGLTIRDGTGAFEAVCGSAGLTSFAGAILTVNSGLEIDRCVLANNFAATGGTIFATAGSLTIRNTTFADNARVPAPNDTASVGSAIYTCPNSAPTPVLIEDSIFTGNGDVSGALPVIATWNAPLTIRRSRFEGNRGGVVQPLGVSDVLIESSMFISNTGIRPAVGMALTAEPSRLRVRRSTFAGNPGDIFATMPTGNSPLEVFDCKFINSQDGAIFYYQNPGGTAVIDRCEFRGAQSVAIAVVADSGQTLIANSLFVGGASDAILINNPQVPAVTLIENSTIVGSAGTGVRTDALLTGTLSIRNSIITGNGTGQVGLPLIPFGQTLEVRRSIVSGGFAGGTNLDVDPQFVNPSGASGDYRLRPTSPAIDAGDNTLITPIVGAGAALDLDLLPRRVDAPGPDSGVGIGAIVDLGAFEFQPPAACPADFDRDGSRTIDDIFVFINAWFVDGPGIDYDNSGGRNIDDIFVFLNAWFAGC